MKERVELWKRAFDGDDHAVLPTLVQFSWDIAAFSTVAELTRLAPDNDRGGKQLNSMVFDLLARSFWGSAVMAIRRLVDGHSIDGARGVYSLRSIVNDVRNHRDGLTRRIFVEDICAQPYDYAEIERRYWAYILAQPPGPVSVPRALDFDSSKSMHAEFDWLSGVDDADRSQDDLIRVEVFDRLNARLTRLDTIADHGTIYFAHAATRESREGRGLQNLNLNEAQDALRELAHVAEFVGRWFCGSGIGDILATPQFDQFEFLDRPLLSDSTIALQRQWDKFAADVSSWPYIRSPEI